MRARSASCGGLKALFTKDLTKTSSNMSNKFKQCWGLLAAFALLVTGFAPEASAQCSDPVAYTVQVAIPTASNGPAEVGWRIVDVATGAVVASAGPQTTTGVAPTTTTGTGSFNVNLIPGKPYQIVMIDAVGNGWGTSNAYTNGTNGIRVRRASAAATDATAYIFGSSTAYRRMGPNHGDLPGDMWIQNLVPFAAAGCGCMDATACNYSATATIPDNGTCAYNPMNLFVDADAYPSEGYLVLTSTAPGAGAGIQGGVTSAGVNFNFCLKDGCYSFRWYDSYGDGMGGAGSPTNPGVVTLSSGHSGNLTGTIANYPNGSITGYQSSITNFCVPVVPGCTDQGACNYNPAANLNQGCDYSCIGCMDVTAANYDPNATIEGPQSCVYCDPNTFVMQIQMTDANGGGWGATQYYLSSIATGTVYSGDFQTANVLTGTIATDLLCLPLGCYTFTVAGGTTADLNAAGYTVLDQFGTEYIATSGAQNQSPLDFGLTGGCNFGGCTDPFCFNFNISANFDNGSCICPPPNSYLETAEAVYCGAQVSGNLTNAFDPEGVVGLSVNNISITTAGVWYEYNAAIDAPVFVDLCGTSTAGFASPMNDGKLHVFRQNPDGTLTLIVGNDDSCGLSPSVMFVGQTGTNYFIYVSKYSTFTSGTNFLLSVNCGECEDGLPFNSTCATALPMLNGVTFTGTTCCAPPPGIPSYSGSTFATNYGVWFTFNSSDYDTFDFNATNIDGGNLTLTVYTSGAGTCTALGTYVGCVFTGTCAGSIETFTALVPNTNYYFVVGTTQPANCGDFEFTTTGIYFGCTDPEADNYDAQANMDDATCTYTEAPVNDLCANALPLPCNQGFIDGSLGGATPDEQSALCLDAVAGSACLNDVYGQYPFSTFTPACTGAQQTITTCGYGAEYSMVYLTAGNTYTFGSSVTSDICTIADEGGTESYAYGVGQAVFTAAQDGPVRFYTHAAGCAAVAGCRTKWVNCSSTPPTPPGGVWYTFTSTGTDLTEIYTCGSVLDTRVHVYQAANGDCASLGCVTALNNAAAISDESFEGCGFFDQDDAYIEFVTVPGTTYYVYVGADGSTNGSFQIAMDCEPAIYGCMISAACNYNPAANIPTTDCEYTSCACANNPDGFPLIISMFDSFGDGWTNSSGGPGGYSIATGDGTVVASGAIDDAIYIVDNDNYEGAEFGLDVLCLDPACYIFTFTGASAWYDEQSWSVSNGTTTILSGAPTGNNTVATYPFTLGSAICGCTDDGACNFNPAATDDNGTCEYLTCAGCTDITACDFDPTATINDGSCCYDNCITLTMADGFGDGWQGCVVSIKTLAGVTVFSGNIPNGGGSSGIALGCLPDGCYTISSSDDTFDGEVSWTLTGVFGGAVSGSSNYPATYISIGGNNCIEGCTVSCACNYDATAVISDDTACTFDNCSGCTYEGALNFNANASSDDGSCQFDLSNPCPADLNEDGSVTTADLLLFLGAFGSICQ